MIGETDVEGSAAVLSSRRSREERTACASDKIAYDGSGLQLLMAI
jgi:hypothetical protein